VLKSAPDFNGERATFVINKYFIVPLGEHCYEQGLLQLLRQRPSSAAAMASCLKLPVARFEHWLQTRALWVTHFHRNFYVLQRPRQLT
jgi:hypothetical protein